MRRRTIVMLFLLISRLCSGDENATPCLPSTYELAFPKAMVQNCFAVKRTPGNIVQIEQTYGHVNFQKSYIHKPLCIGDKIYDHGIGVHAVSDLLVQLPKPAIRFTVISGNHVPFSFALGGRTSRDVLSSWACSTSE